MKSWKGRLFTRIQLYQLNDVRMFYSAVVVVDRFYKALFSAFQQARCVIVARGSKGMTVAFDSAV